VINKNLYVVFLSKAAILRGREVQVILMRGICFKEWQRNTSTGQIKNERVEAFPHPFDLEQKELKNR